MTVLYEDKYIAVAIKPAGVLSEGEMPDLLAESLGAIRAERGEAPPSAIYPVHRLDKETEGLLLLSNDGEFCKLMTHPRYGCKKTYFVRVAGKYTEEKIATLRSRMDIDGYIIRPVVVEVLKVGRDNVHKLSFTLAEGRNRQIRKMCAQVGFTVLQLKRMRIGSLHIGEMKPGDWRELSPADVQALKRRALRQAAKTGGDC